MYAVTNNSRYFHIFWSKDEQLSPNSDWKKMLHRPVHGCEESVMAPDTQGGENHSWQPFLNNFFLHFYSRAAPRSERTVTQWVECSGPRSNYWNNLMEPIYFASPSGIAWLLFTIILSALLLPSASDKEQLQVVSITSTLMHFFSCNLPPCIFSFLRECDFSCIATFTWVRIFYPKSRVLWFR